MRVALGIALLCLTAAAQDLEGARQQFAAQLDAFATWSGKKNLRGFRDRAYELLLRYQPDHKKARKALKFRFNKKTQSWERKTKYARPSDKPGVAREDATGRWNDLTDAYADKLLARFADWTAGTREDALAELLEVAPNHHGVRKANGEVKQGAEWVLMATPAARERRRQIVAWAAKARQAVPSPEPQPVAAEDGEFGIVFPMAWHGQAWRGLGTVPEEEIRETVRAADAAYPILNRLFDGTLKPGTDLSVYLLKGGKRAATIALTKHPAYTPADRRFALQLDGSWVPGKLAFVTWDEHALNRTDIVARQAIGLYLRQRFGITGKLGWAYEGIGLYAGYLVCGTRLNTSALRTGYTADKKALQEQERGVKFSKVDWVKLAAKLFEKKPEPDLRGLLAKDVNTLSADDLLVSYALAAYLIEGHPKLAPAFLAAYGKGAELDAALREHLDVEYPTFRDRFRRWLAER